MKKPNAEEIREWLRELFKSEKHGESCGPDCPCWEIKEHLKLKP